MFEDSSTYAQYMKTFSSMEGNENYKPYFFIRYNSYTPVTNVKLSNSSLTLNVGKNYTFSPIVYPSTATNQEFTWESSNENVATVINGKVTYEPISNPKDSTKFWMSLDTGEYVSSGGL